MTTPEERRAAAEKLYEIAWGNEEPQFRPNKQRWVKNALDGIVSALSIANQINLVATLTRAEDLLEQARLMIYLTPRIKAEIAAFLEEA
jgi:hypothetical protein